MAFIKLDKPLELLEGETKRNIKVDDDKVKEKSEWLYFMFEEHTFRVPINKVSFVRYSDIEESDETEVLIS